MAPDDQLLNMVTWKIPNALALVGSRAGDERNAMTTSWITQLSMEPVLIGVGVDNTASGHDKHPVETHLVEKVVVTG